MVSVHTHLEVFFMKLPLPFVAAALMVGLCAAPAMAQSKKSKGKADAVMPQASADQIDALSKADLGEYTCEQSERITVSAHPKYPGYALLAHRKQQYVMRPVVSHTGAIRLEDMRGQTLMIQIATKAMFMDAKLGQRLADGCLRAGDNNRAHTPSEGLGINAKAGG
jgi:hypothetical protein